MATAPSGGRHFIIGFLDQAGSAGEVEVFLAGLPDEAREHLPTRREQARASFEALQGASSSPR